MMNQFTPDTTLKPATLLKVTILNGCFSRFLNSTSGIKLHKVSHISLTTVINEQ